MFPDMIQYTAKAFLMDENSVILVLLLSLLSFTITKLTIDNPFVAFASLPTYFFAALFANMWIREFGFVASTDKVANLAFACGAGFMVAILALVLTYRLISSIFTQ